MSTGNTLNLRHLATVSAGERLLEAMSFGILFGKV